MTMLFIGTDPFSQELLMYSQTITLYDRRGQAVAYIDPSDGQTIFLWDGTPVAYLMGEHIYGFNGFHLGWFINGRVFDHIGYIRCVTKDRFRGYTQYVPYKQYKKYKPYKAYRRYPPYKPYMTNHFSIDSCRRYLARGRGYW